DDIKSRPSFQALSPEDKQDVIDQYNQANAPAQDAPAAPDEPRPQTWFDDLAPEERGRRKAYVQAAPPDQQQAALDRYERDALLRRKLVFNKAGAVRAPEA